MKPSSWRELARPQVHGYDLLGAVFIDPLKFVSIGDEKVARVFEAPNGFVSLLESLGVSHFDEKEVGSHFYSMFYLSDSSSITDQPVLLSLPSDYRTKLRAKVR